MARIISANRAAASMPATFHENRAEAGSTWLRLILTRAVHSSDDSDTVAAIAGAVAGSYLGACAVPSEWADKVHGLPTGEDGEPLHAADLRELGRATALAGLT